MASQRVVVGISGGVDSSVAAYRLLQQGYEVVGAFMRNWNDSTGLLKGDCPFEEDSQFAALVCRKLGIPLEIVDLSEEYRRDVVDYLFQEYAVGRTPNPDVLCNREIKFKAFWEAARALGADCIATGHYCRREVRVSPRGTSYHLLSGVDASKDQSYFLCQVNQEQLSHALFPLGDVHKRDVRALAKSLGLATAERRDSYGICFVGEVDLPTFLAQRLAPRDGAIVEIPRDEQFPPRGDSLAEQAVPYTLTPDMGIVVGHHRGAHFYTVGQRKGLGIGGKALPLFVLAVDVTSNILYVGQGHDHPALLRRVVHVAQQDVHWICPANAPSTSSPLRVMARLRHRQPLQPASLIQAEEGVYLQFDEPQRGVTPGQFAAWYLDDELLGAGPVSC